MHSYCPINASLSVQLGILACNLIPIESFKEKRKEEREARRKEGKNEARTEERTEGKVKITLLSERGL